MKFKRDLNYDKIIFMKETIIGNLIYGQSGGPTSVINSSAYGVIKEARKHKNIISKVYAMHFGLEGLLNNDLIDLDNYTLEELAKLKNTPGAAFGSNRYKLSHYSADEKDYIKIIDIFKKYNIRFFLYNGGNDSMDTIHKISEYAKKVNYELYCVGIPKTIDNDLPFIDHTAGYASAIKFIANAVSEIYLDDHSYKKGRVNIVEIMGRNAGWLTAGSLLSKLNGTAPDLIYVPEVPFDLTSFLNDVKSIYETKQHCLVCVSEGIKDENGNFIFETSELKDKFGHTQLGGVASRLAKIVEKEFNYKTRAFELSLLQRANSILPSSLDIKEAIKVGEFALKKAIKGENDKIVTLKRIGTSSKYKIKYDLIDIALVANKEKYLPLTYINSKCNYINDTFLDYALPLIQDKKDNTFNNGLLNVFKLK